MEHLKLVAFDAEDLSVLSAHVQNAETRALDMIYQSAPQRFVLMVVRYDWQKDAATGQHERVQAGMHFDHVTAVSTFRLDRASEKVLTLLSVTFQDEAAPSGVITLTFADDMAIKLQVECLDVQLRDMGPRWSVAAAPDPVLAKGETEFGN